MNVVQDSARTKELVFALASCQYPPGLLDQDLADRTLHKLAAVGVYAKPRFMIRVGDQIYVDATAGLFDPARLDEALVDAYGSLTRGAGYGAAQKLFEMVPGQMSGIHCMLDDHEISDNWEPEPGSPRNAEILEQGRAAYVEGLRSRPEHPGWLSEYQPGAALWYHETDLLSGHRFFFADSRTMRAPRSAVTLDNASILGAEQWQDLRAWLHDAPVGCVSFVSTPAILLPRRLSTSTQPAAALHSDAWDGYPASLHAMLACVCDEAPGPVVFLSGDEHLSCAAKFEISRKEDPARVVVGCSIHSSALYAPYPFANGCEENFSRMERFEFCHDDGGVLIWYECRVEAWFPEPVDSVAIVSIRESDEGCRLEVAFHQGRTSSEAPPQCWSTALNR